MPLSAQDSGFSQGAMLSLYAGQRLAPACAGILAYSGALVGPVVAASPAATPPICLIHGVHDDVVPASASRSADIALKEAGYAPDLHILPALAHSIDAAGLQKGLEFLQTCLR